MGYLWIPLGSLLPLGGSWAQHEPRLGPSRQRKSSSDDLGPGSACRRQVSGDWKGGCHQHTRRRMDGTMVLSQRGARWIVAGNLPESLANGDPPRVKRVPQVSWGSFVSPGYNLAPVVHLGDGGHIFAQWPTFAPSAF